MGCDIEMYAEVNKNDKWELVKDGQFEYCVYDGRNYDLFALLADVRNKNNIKPIVECRYLPDDCCEYVRDAFYNDCNIHSINWYTLDELFKYKKEIEFISDCFWNNICKLLNYVKEDEKNIRIIFGFGN